MLYHDCRPEDSAPVDWSGTDIAAHVESYITSGMSKKDAIKAVARDRGVHKSVIYKEILSLYYSFVNF